MYISMKLASLCTIFFCVDGIPDGYCSATISCTDGNSDCTDNVCKCTSGYSNINGVCKEGKCRIF